MTKLLAGVAAVLAFGVLSAVSAQVDLSAGGGIFYAGDGGGGVYGSKLEGGGTTEYQTVPWGGFGIGAFFDATYAEASVSLVFGGGKTHYSHEDNDERVWAYSKKDGASFTSLNIGALGKYPIPLGPVTAFPAVGFDYAVVIGAEGKQGGQTVKFDGKNGAPKAGDLSAFWLKFGGGADYNLNDKLYVRPELLYGIRFANKFEADGTKNISGADPALGHGWTVKAGVGYKL
jgi:hypothetical protein